MKPVNHTENEPEVVSRITELLIKQGRTQTELLEYLGLHRNNFTEWKAGRKRSYLLYIDEIARYFDVSVVFLFVRSDFKHVSYIFISLRYITIQFQVDASPI